MTGGVIDLTAASPDPGFALGVLFAVAAGFFAVGFHYYIRLTGAGERLFVRRLRRRLQRASKFLAVQRIGRVLWLADVTLVVSWRAIGLVYVGTVWFLIVPLLMTLGSIVLSAAILNGA